MTEKLESWQSHITRYITADFARFACWHTDKSISSVLRVFWETPMFWDNTVEQQLYFDWCHEQGIEFNDDLANDCVTMLHEYIEKMNWDNHYDMMIYICEHTDALNDFTIFASAHYGDDFVHDCIKAFFEAFNVSYCAHYRSEMLENVGDDWGDDNWESHDWYWESLM